MASRNFFEQYGEISKEGVDMLNNKLKPNKIKKGDQLLSYGQICKQIYFVTKGCLRLYYISDGVEITVWFSFEDNSAIELSSFLSGKPTEYFIEAIEDSEYLSLDKSELLGLYGQFPEMESVVRCFWEDVILNLLQRFTALQKDSAEDRYLNLINQNNYLQRVPQKYLASYIGVTPTSLSRIKRNLR
jgi:CRP-like cAMP-binding protein